MNHEQDQKNQLPSNSIPDNTNLPPIPNSTVPTETLPTPAAVAITATATAVSRQGVEASKIVRSVMNNLQLVTKGVGLPLTVKEKDLLLHLQQQQQQQQQQKLQHHQNRRQWQQQQQQQQLRAGIQEGNQQQQQQIFPGCATIATKTTLTAAEDVATSVVVSQLQRQSAIFPNFSSANLICGALASANSLAILKGSMNQNNNNNNSNNNNNNNNDKQTHEESHRTVHSTAHGPTAQVVGRASTLSNDDADRLASCSAFNGSNWRVEDFGGYYYHLVQIGQGSFGVASIVEWRPFFVRPTTTPHQTSSERRQEQHGNDDAASSAATTNAQPRTVKTPSGSNNNNNNKNNNNDDDNNDDDGDPEKYIFPRRDQSILAASGGVVDVELRKVQQLGTIPSPRSIKKIKSSAGGRNSSNSINNSNNNNNDNDNNDNKDNNISAVTNSNCSNSNQFRRNVVERGSRGSTMLASKNNLFGDSKMEFSFKKSQRQQHAPPVPVARTTSGDAKNKNNINNNSSNNISNNDSANHKPLVSFEPTSATANSKTATTTTTTTTTNMTKNNNNSGGGGGGGGGGGRGASNEQQRQQQQQQQTVRTSNNNNHNDNNNNNNNNIIASSVPATWRCDGPGGGVSSLSCTKPTLLINGIEYSRDHIFVCKVEKDFDDPELQKEARKENRAKRRRDRERKRLELSKQREQRRLEMIEKKARAQRQKEKEEARNLIRLGQAQHVADDGRGDKESAAALVARLQKKQEGGKSESSRQQFKQQRGGRGRGGVQQQVDIFRQLSNDNDGNDDDDDDDEYDDSSCSSPPTCNGKKLSSVGKGNSKAATNVKGDTEGGIIDDDGDDNNQDAALDNSVVESTITSSSSSSSDDENIDAHDDIADEQRNINQHGQRPDINLVNNSESKEGIFCCRDGKQNEQNPTAFENEIRVDASPGVAASSFEKIVTRAGRDGRDGGGDDDDGETASLGNAALLPPPPSQRQLHRLGGVSTKGQEDYVNSNDNENKNNDDESEGDQQEEKQEQQQQQQQKDRAKSHSIPTGEARHQDKDQNQRQQGVVLTSPGNETTTTSQKQSHKNNNDKVEVAAVAGAAAVAAEKTRTGSSSVSPRSASSASRHRRRGSSVSSVRRSSSSSWSFRQQSVRVAHLAGIERARRMHREAQILSNLAHPNIVSFVDSFARDGKKYLILEYIDGGDLEREIKRRREPTVRHFTIESCLFLWVQAVLAVEFLHRNNIMHRDLKTSNLLVSKKWIVKLSDFGTAQQFDKDTTGEITSAVCGSPAWMAPEHYLVTPEGIRVPYSEKADVWSLGVILWELINIVAPPFVGSTVHSLAQRIVREPPRPMAREHVPSDVMKLLFRMLDKDPNRRPTCLEILSVDFMQAAMKSYLTRFEAAVDGKAATKIDHVWLAVLKEHCGIISRSAAAATTIKATASTTPKCKGSPVRNKNDPHAVRTDSHDNNNKNKNSTKQGRDDNPDNNVAAAGGLDVAEKTRCRPRRHASLPRKISSQVSRNLSAKKRRIIVFRRLQQQGQPRPQQQQQQQQTQQLPNQQQTRTVQQNT